MSTGRAGAPADSFHPHGRELVEFRIQRLASKRNALVHEGLDVHIGRKDVDLLKSFCDALLTRYLTNDGKFTLAEIRFFLDHGGKDLEALRRTREEWDKAAKDLQAQTKLVRKLETWERQRLAKQAATKTESGRGKAAKGAPSKKKRKIAQGKAVKRLGK